MSTHSNYSNTIPHLEKYPDAVIAGAKKMDKTPKAHQLVLDNLPLGTREEALKQLLRTKKLSFKKVEIWSKQNSIQFGGGSLSAYIIFASKEDLVKVAREVVGKQSFRIGTNQLHMRILRDKAHFNAETSVFVGSLNQRCTEQHIISELNQIFNYNKTYRKELQKWEHKRKTNQKQIGQKSKSGTKGKPEDICEYFVLGCLVFVHHETGAHKRFAFIDLDCNDAALVVIKAWNQRSMTAFFNTLSVCLYTSEHQRETPAQRQLRSPSRERTEKKLTNLYVESLPYSFDEQDVRELFSIYGDVTCVKVKKPLKCLPITNIDSLSCSAYVNFKTNEHALAAQAAMHGKSLVPGARAIYVDFYQQQNRFPGVHKGLNRQELLENTHFRVLYISGLYPHVTKRDLWTICLKYGAVDVVTLKTRIQNNEETSRCKAIVQFSTKEGAACALKSLPFEDGLGSDGLDINFYQSTESRLAGGALVSSHEKADRGYAYTKGLSEDDELQSQLTQLIPVFQALQQQQEVNKQKEKQSSAGGEGSSVSPTSSASTLAPISADQFTAPTYVIRPFHFRLPKSKQLHEKPAYPKSQPYLQHQQYHTEHKRSSSNKYQPRVTIQEEKTQNQEKRARKEKARGFKWAGGRATEAKVYQVKQESREVVSNTSPTEAEKPKAHVQFDTESLNLSLKLDLTSVLSRRTKDLEEEEKARQQTKKSPAYARSKSWRNPDIRRKEISEGESINLQNQNTDSRKPKKNVFGVNKEKQGGKTSRRQSTSPKGQERKHSYSPRYLDFLHQSPNQSPRDGDFQAADAVFNGKEQMKKKPIWGHPKAKNLLDIASPRAKKEQGGHPPFGSKPIQHHAIKMQLAGQTQLPLKHTMSQTFNTQDIYAHMDSINRINDPQGPVDSSRVEDMDYDFSSPVKLTYMPPVQGVQSPQPNLSPSSLINYLYAQEQEGFSAPLIQNCQQSSASKSLSGTKEKAPAFGMFNWNWESSGDEDQQSNNQPREKSETE